MASNSADERAVDRYLRALEDNAGAATQVHPELERQFVDAAGPFSRHRGISYGAWRDVGVPADVLARAGVHDPLRRARRRGCAHVPVGVKGARGGRPGSAPSATATRR